MDGPGTAKPVRIFEEDTGINGPPIWSEFIKGGWMDPWTAESVQIFQKDCRDPWTADLVRFLKGMQGPTDGRIRPIFSKVMQSSTDGRTGLNFEKGMQGSTDRYFGSNL